GTPISRASCRPRRNSVARFFSEESDWLPHVVFSRVVGSCDRGMVLSVIPSRPLVRPENRKTLRSSISLGSLRFLHFLHCCENDFSAESRRHLVGSAKDGCNLSL